MRRPTTACIHLSHSAVFFVISGFSLGADKGGYYHELFLRGKQFLAQLIAFRKIKGSMKPKTRAPNFFALPFLPGTNANPARVQPPPACTASANAPLFSSGNSRAMGTYAAFGLSQNDSLPQVYKLPTIKHELERELIEEIARTQSAIPDCRVTGLTSPRLLSSSFPTYTYLKMCTVNPASIEAFAREMIQRRTNYREY
jgi:hypothetical protein